MGKKFGPEIEYAWDKNWLIEWNEPRHETVKGIPDRVTGYDHNLIIQLELQDGNKETRREYSRKITLFSTERRLTVEERLTLLTGREIRREIIENLVRLKDEIADYQMVVGEEED
jgi:hypothetical protein